MPEGPAVRKIGNGCPQRDVVAVQVVPSLEGEVYKLHKIRVRVVVEGVAVDVPEHVPVVGEGDRVVEVCPGE